MNRAINAVLAAFLLATLVATSTASSRILKDNGKQATGASPWISVPAWRGKNEEKNGPATIDWNDEEYRLPGDLLPSVYTLRLLPFLEVDNFTTDGFMEVWVDCVKNTKSIVLNSLDITIDRLSIAVSRFICE